MKQDYYITTSGTIKRKGNTLYIENNEMKKALPIHHINSLYCLGEVTLNSKLLSLFSQQNIPIHFFNYYGFYTGTFYPKEYLVSGSLLIHQVKHYIDQEKRLFIAKHIVEAMAFNMLKILEHYYKHGKNVKQQMSAIEELKEKIGHIQTVKELLQVEGAIWSEYYQTFNKILKSAFHFEKRVIRPPDNMINCLLSFGNSLLYTTTLSEIYHTQLHPAVSYLHEPFERRFSLALDISEMFKPLIVHKAIFKLINKQELKEEHFDKALNFCYLNEKGRRIVLQEYDARLKNVIDHRELKRNISTKRLIRLECYKLIKHLLDDKQYEGFKIWW
jgi:CRISPR-associated protein Cas1